MHLREVNSSFFKGDGRGFLKEGVKTSSNVTNVASGLANYLFCLHICSLWLYLTLDAHRVIIENANLPRAPGVLLQRSFQAHTLDAWQLQTGPRRSGARREKVSSPFPHAYPQFLKEQFQRASNSALLNFFFLLDSASTWVKGVNGVERPIPFLRGGGERSSAMFDGIKGQGSRQNCDEVRTWKKKKKERSFVQKSISLECGADQTQVNPRWAVAFFVYLFSTFGRRGV